MREPERPVWAGDQDLIQGTWAATFCGAGIRLFGHTLVFELNIDHRAYPDLLPNPMNIVEAKKRPLFTSFRYACDALNPLFALVSAPMDDLREHYPDLQEAVEGGYPEFWQGAIGQAMTYLTTESFQGMSRSFIRASEVVPTAHGVIILESH